MKKKNWRSLILVVLGYVIAALGVIASGISFGFLLIIGKREGMLESAILLLFSTLLWEISTKAWLMWLNGEKDDVQ